MAATSSESVETITDSNTPLSSAGAMVYAIAGWPASGLTFFPGTRFEPCRAGIRATAEGEPPVPTSMFPVPGSCSCSVQTACSRSAFVDEAASNNKPLNSALRTEDEHEPGTGHLEREQPPLDGIRIVIDIDGFQVRVHVERLRTGFTPAIARLAQAAEWHVRLAAVGAAVHDGHAGLNPGEEGHRAVDVLRVDRRRQPERRVVGKRDRLVEAAHAIQTGDRAKQLAARNLVVRSDVLEDRRRHEVAVAIATPGQPVSSRQHRRAGTLRALHRRQHVRHLLVIDDRTVIVPVARPDLQTAGGLDEH